MNPKIGEKIKMRAINSNEFIQSLLEFENVYSIFCERKCHIIYKDNWRFYELDSHEISDPWAFGYLITYLITRNGILPYPSPNMHITNINDRRGMFFTGFLAWLQNISPSFTSRLWANIVSKKLAEYSEYNHTPNLSERRSQNEWQRYLNNPNYYFSKQFIVWAETYHVNNETKLDYYKNVDQSADAIYWRVNLVFSEIGICEEYDDFNNRFFTMSLNEYLDADEDFFKDRFNEILDSSDYQNDQISNLKQSKDTLVSIANGFIFVASRIAKKIDNETNTQWPMNHEDLDQFIDSFVNEGILNKSTGKKLKKLSNKIVFKDIANSPISESFKGYFGFRWIPTNNKYLTCLHIEGKASAPGRIILNTTCDKYVVGVDEDSKRPLISANGAFYQPQSFEGTLILKATYENDDMLISSAEIKCQNRHVRFFMKINQHHFVEVSEKEIFRASLILILNLNQNNLLNLLRDAGADVQIDIPLTNQLPSAITNYWQAFKYTHPINGFSRSVPLGDRIIRPDETKPKPFKITGLPRAIPHQDIWHPFFPPRVEVLDRDWEPFADGLFFQRTDDRNGYINYEVLPSGEQFPPKTTVSFKNKIDNSTIPDASKEIAFKVDQSGYIGQLRGGLNKFGEWFHPGSIDQQSLCWRGASRQDSTGAHKCINSPEFYKTKFQFTPISHRHAMSYKGVKIWPCDSPIQNPFPDDWNKIAMAFRNAPRGYIDFRQLNDRIKDVFKDGNGMASISRISSDYVATGLLEFEKNDQGIPQNYHCVKPVAYLSPYLISENMRNQNILVRGRQGKNGIHDLVRINSLDRPNYFVCLLGGSFTQDDFDKLLKRAQQLSDNWPDNSVEIWFRKPDNSDSFDSRAYPPTITVLATSIELFDKLFQETDFEWTGSVPSQELCEYISSKQDIMTQINTGLHTGVLKPRNAKEYNKTKLRPTNSPIYPKHYYVPRGIVNQFDKHFLVTYDSNQYIEYYHFWQDEKMIQFLVAASDWKPIYFKSKNELQSPIRFPYLMERALSLCWDKTVMKENINGKTCFCYRGVPEKIARQLCRRLLDRDLKICN